MTAAHLLADMRMKRGFSQAELARRSGIPRTAINAYERGTRIPGTRTLLRLTEACGRTLQTTPRPQLDLEGNARVLEQVLDLAELLPARPGRRLTFPPLP